MHLSSTGYKRKQSKAVLNKYKWTTGDGYFHWRKWYYGYFTRSDSLKIKKIIMMNVFITNMLLLSAVWALIH